MTEEQLYWRQSKLDYLDEAVSVIDDKEQLKAVIAKMSKTQLNAVFKEFEDPYSMFNYGEEYTSYYWERFKAAVNSERPDVNLF